MHDVAVLIRSLWSRLCPGCGRQKKSGHTLCGTCYRNVPADIQNALYDRVGAGYEEAFARAMKFLGVERPLLPGPGAVDVPRESKGAHHV